MTPTCCKWHLIHSAAQTNAHLFLNPCSAHGLPMLTPPHLAYIAEAGLQLPSSCLCPLSTGIRCLCYHFQLSLSNLSTTPHSAQVQTIGTVKPRLCLSVSKELLAASKSAMFLCWLWLAVNLIDSSITWEVGLCVFRGILST